MAGNIDGYFHDNVLVRGSEMAKITNALAGQRSYVVPDYAQNMNITASGLNVTVQPGFAVIQGYPVIIKQPMTLSLPANSTVYLVITIDKSKEVTYEGDPSDPGAYLWENNQVSLDYVATLVDGNLSNEDVITTFNLAKIITNATTASIEKNSNSYADGRSYKVLYNGGKTYNNGAFSLSDDISNFKMLAVTWTSYGNRSTSTYIDPTQAMDIRMSGVNLPDSAQAGGWVIMEAFLKINGNQASWVYTKETSNGGAITNPTGNFVLISIVGWY